MIDDQVGGASTRHLTVTVNNVAPIVTINGPTAVNERDNQKYSFTVVDPGTDEFSIDSQSCGSGTVLSDPTFGMVQKASKR